MDDIEHDFAGQQVGERRAFIGNRWVLHARGGDFVAHHADDLIWVYRERVWQIANGIPYRITDQVVMWNRANFAGVVAMPKRLADASIALLKARMPWLITGYSKALRDSWNFDRADMIAMVDNIANTTQFTASHYAAIDQAEGELEAAQRAVNRGALTGRIVLLLIVGGIAALLASGGNPTTPADYAYQASRRWFGDGVAQDRAEAVRLYQIAAEQGDVSAQLMLAQIYSNGDSVEQDDAQAARYYRLAVDQGDAGAQGWLGLLYCEGRGVEQDESECLRLMQAGADGGDQYAQLNLGTFYHNGEYVARDYGEAARLYQLSANQGNATAQTYLAALFEQGVGVPQNRAEAINFYRLGARQGNEEAQAALTRLGENW
jgi:TPR repeat protein